MKTVHENSKFIPFSFSQDLIVLLLRKIETSPGEPASQCEVLLSESRMKESHKLS